MKKLVLLFFLAFFAELTAYAQTYYYKYLNSVNPNGVKIKTDNFYRGKDIYMTFVNNYNILAPFTDKEGVSMDFYCKYIGNQNNILSYKGFFNNSPSGYGASLGVYGLIGGSNPTDIGNILFYFSSNYDRLNIKMPNGLIHVLERRISPEDEKAPDSLY